MANLTSVPSTATGESAEWLNTMIRYLWPYINEFSKTIMKDMIEPMVNETVPGAVKPVAFKKMSLGSTPLCINQVLVHTSRHDSMLLDMDIDFVGDPEISLSFAGGAIEGGIEKLHISGRLCVLLQPLVSTIPLVGAVQAAFINAPNLEMSYSGIAELGEFGLIKKAVSDAVMSIMSSMVVYPNRILVKLSEAVDFFGCFHHPEGLLRLSVTEAKGFKTKGFAFFKDVPDPYVKVQLGGETLTTEMVKNSEHPTFTATKDFLLFDSRQELSVAVYDSDVLVDKRYGRATVPIKEALAGGELWVTVKSDDGKDGPQVRLVAQLLLLLPDPALPLQEGKNNVVVAVSIDRAVGLKKTARAKVKVTIGKESKETGEVVESSMVDMTRPVYNTTLMFLAESVDGQSVVMEVLSKSTALGRVTLSLDDCMKSPSMLCHDTYVLADSPMEGATLRAMCRVLRVKQ